MNIIKITSNFHDIQLNLKGTNFTSTLSSWAYKDEKLCFLVDTGPTSSIESLKHALDKIGIKKNDLKYILLSHIHMDHAGGVGKLLKYFPKAQVICHPKGIKHLINPKKLWEGSLKVLGEVAELYGEITPVPEDRIRYQQEAANGRIKVIDTSGHAPHHLSYIFNKYLFIGEAAGVNNPLPGKIYTRPATPPVFNYEDSISSIQKLLKEDLEDRLICYAHFGSSKNAEFLLKLAQDQINLWIQVINDLFELKDQPSFFNKVVSMLKNKDEYFANIELLDANMKEKELFFVGNSIKGILGHIQKKKENT